jgi:CRISPR/Cas system-associated exonuclease Cas4 (RecB family)
MKNKYNTIDDAICGYLDKESKRTNVKRGFDYWSASSLGKCRRYQTLCRANIQNNNTVNYAWRNAAMDGHAGHEWRQAALESIGVLKSKELPLIDEKLHYRGHYDMVVELNGKLVVGDIKTMNNRAFRARSRMPGGIDPCHKRQLASYFYFLRRDVYPDLKGAHLYYVNKNTGEREEYSIYFERGFLTDVINELKDLNRHWDAGLLPKKEIGNFCRICPHYNLCKDLKNRKTIKIKDAIQRSLQKTI